MTPEEVKAIVREEVGQMLLESGIVEALSGFLLDTPGLAIFTDLIPLLSVSGDVKEEKDED